MVQDTDEEFTLDEARHVLAAVRSIAPHGMRAPLSQEDMAAAVAAGIELKGAQEGLLDFPAYVDGVPAYWCWKAGERDIMWWHPRDTGFADRRRIVGETGLSGSLPGEDA